MDWYTTQWQLDDGDTVDRLLDDYAACAWEIEAAVAGVEDLSQPVPVPEDEPWFPADMEAWSVRWVLLHLIEEVARHAGHADIIRSTSTAPPCTS